VIAQEYGKDAQFVYWKGRKQDVDHATFEVDAERRKNLFLIFKETINNAAKYSGATTVDIVLRKSEGTLVMTVSDNGQGFARQNVKDGNGLKNMDARAKAMDAQFKLTSGAGKGTCMELELPIT